MTAAAESKLAMPPVAASSEGMQTVGKMLLQSLARFEKLPAIRYKVKKEWQTITYQELYRHACEVAVGLLALGLKAGDKVALLSENRPEWIFVDLACQLLGITDVPIYPSLPAGQVEYILRDSGSRAIVVSDASQLKKIQKTCSGLPDLQTTIIMEPAAQKPDGAGETASSQDLLSLEELKARGASSQYTGTEVKLACDAVKPGDLASIVYTSGTTGDPKGAMLTNWNFMSNVTSVSQFIVVGPGDVFLSFLPLNHVFERLAGYYLPISSGSTVAYAESALRVKQNLPEVQPTVMIGVPRLYDGLREGVLAAVAKKPDKQQKLFRWATAVGSQRARALESKKSPGLLTSLQWLIADRLVLQKVRETLGANNLRYFVSGSAPLPRATADFLLSIGIPFLEGYGLTETSPVISVNRPDDFRVGSVGQAIPGVEVAIAEDGEIISRGPHIMKGYLNKPEATAEGIDKDGWFHTGDVGRLDEDGFLFITDRKKDLLVLATGKKVAPQPIEAKLKASPFIREVVVLGDHLSSCVALVVPALDRLGDHGRKEGWKFSDNKELCALPEAKKFIRGEVDKMSADLAEYERIRNIALLDHEFTLESGELTPTLKVKRKVVAANYADVIKGLAG